MALEGDGEGAEGGEEDVEIPREWRVRRDLSSREVVEGGRVVVNYRKLRRRPRARVLIRGGRLLTRGSGWQEMGRASRRIMRRRCASFVRRMWFIMRLRLVIIGPAIFVR